MITIMVVPATQRRLEVIVRETGRTIENIASEALEDVALEYFLWRDDDPAKLGDES